MKLVALIFDVGQVALFASALLSPKPFLSPVAFEETLFEERLTGLTALHIVGGINMS